MKPQQTLESINIIDINYQVLEGNRGLRGDPIGTHRFLGTLTIEYEIIVEEICNSGDCKARHENANDLYDQVVGSLKDETESGEFSRSLQANAVEASVMFLSHATVGSSDFGRFVVGEYFPTIFLHFEV